MRKALAFLLPLALAAGACADDARSPAAPDVATPLLRPGADPVILLPGDDYVPQRVLVRFKPGAPVGEILAANAAAIEGLLPLDISMLAVPIGFEKVVAQALASNPWIEFAEPDYLRTAGIPCDLGECDPPNDPFFGYKWDHHNDGTINNSLGDQLAVSGLVDADIDWLEAYEALGDFQGSAVIGILDTGVMTTHPDLAGRVIGEYDAHRNRDRQRDRNGHGTHVAGIAAARAGNATGVTGVAYGPNIGILAVSVCPSFCPTSAIINGITWAVDHGANVLNLSLGGPSGSIGEQQALQYARANDVLPFCAAGNGGTGFVEYPAHFPECVAVSATDWFDGLASYSSFGPEVELSAPGGDGESGLGYSYILSSYNDGGYAFIAGTSMATPQAAGLATLLHALGVTDDDAKLQLMKDTADDLGAPGPDNVFGFGRINVHAAVTGGGPPPPPPPPPPGDGIVLAVTPGLSGGQYQVELEWTGAVGAQVDVLRLGRLLATTANDGAYTDVIGPRAPGRPVPYQVCEAGSTTECSDVVEAVF